MIILKHFENGKKFFNSEKSFIDFVKMLFVENELYKNSDSPIKSLKIKSFQDAKMYVKNHCSNFDFIDYDSEV